MLKSKTMCILWINCKSHSPCLHVWMFRSSLPPVNWRLHCALFSRFERPVNKSKNWIFGSSFSWSWHLLIRHRVCPSAYPLESHSAVFSSLRLTSFFSFGNRQEADFRVQAAQTTDESRLKSLSLGKQLGFLDGGSVVTSRESDCANKLISGSLKEGISKSKRLSGGVSIEISSFCGELLFIWELHKLAPTKIK